MSASLRNRISGAILLAVALVWIVLVYQTIAPGQAGRNSYSAALRCMDSVFARYRSRPGMTEHLPGTRMNPKSHSGFSQEFV